MSKLFYITNERSFKNEFYLLQPLRCCIQYTTLFSLRKASAHKKQTPAVLKAHRSLMAIPILLRIVDKGRHLTTTKEDPARGIDAATLAAETGHAQPSTTLVIYTQVYHKQPSRELYEKQRIAATLFCKNSASAFFLWAVRDSNPHSSGYEKASLVKISESP